jgi:hypothetical protein
VRGSLSAAETMVKRAARNKTMLMYNARDLMMVKKKVVVLRRLCVLRSLIYLGEALFK